MKVNLSQLQEISDCFWNIGPWRAKLPLKKLFISLKITVVAFKQHLWNLCSVVIDHLATSNQPRPATLHMIDLGLITGFAQHTGSVSCSGMSLRYCFYHCYCCYHYYSFCFYHYYWCYLYYCFSFHPCEQYYFSSFYPRYFSTTTRAPDWPPATAATTPASSSAIAVTTTSPPMITLRGDSPRVGLRPQGSGIFSCLLLLLLSPADPTSVPTSVSTMVPAPLTAPQCLRLHLWPQGSELFYDHHSYWYCPWSCSCSCSCSSSAASLPYNLRPQGPIFKLCTLYTVHNLFCLVA